MAVAIGDKAPAFTLLNQAGEKISLSDYRGKKNVVLYFYPRASTPGCTVQACGIRDSMDRLKSLDAEVLALSPDTVEKIAKFVTKQALNFNLLSDEGHKVADLYGVWGLKKFMGKENMGIIRSTFIINKQGTLVYKIPKFTTKNHHEVVVEYLSEHLPT